MAVAQMRSSAADELGLGPGDEITLTTADKSEQAGMAVPVALRGGRDGGR